MKRSRTMKQIPTCKDGRGCERDKDLAYCPKTDGWVQAETIKHCKPEGTHILWCSNYKELGIDG
jgi:hypothetical protein